MADIWGASGAPRWQAPQETALESYRAGESVAQSFSQAFSSAFDRAQEQASPLGKARIAQAQAQTQASMFQIDQAKNEANAQVEDQKSLFPWLSLTPDKRMETPIPSAPKSKMFWQIVQNTQRNDEQFAWRKQAADNNSLKTKLQLKVEENTLKDIDALPEDLQGEVMSAPNPELMRARLSDAKQIAEQRKTTAAEEARARGDTVTTTFSPRGETTTVKSAPGAAVGPHTIETQKLPSGQLVWRDTGAKGVAGAWKTLRDPALELEGRAALTSYNKALTEYNMAVQKNGLDSKEAEDARKGIKYAEDELNSLYTAKMGTSTEKEAPSKSQAEAMPGTKEPASMMGTIDNPANPTSQEEFDALPSGAFFINPADGKLMKVK